LSFTHKHSPTAPQRYPSSPKRHPVSDEQTISVSCEPPWTSGNARSPPPAPLPDWDHLQVFFTVVPKPQVQVTSVDVVVFSGWLAGM